MDKPPSLTSQSVLAKSNALYLLLLITLISRLPFLWKGFGAHPDEWRIIRSGLDVWLEHRYWVSRPMGYPINEIMMGGLAWLGGSPLCSIATLLASLLMLALWVRLACLYEIRRWFWPAMAISFNPWFWKSSTHALDYNWGLLAMTAGFVLLELTRFRTSALLCGVGLSLRPTNGLWNLGIVWRTWTLLASWPQRIQFLAVWVITGLIALAPVLWAAQHWALADRGSFFHQYAFTLRRISFSIFHTFEFFGHLPGILVLTIAVIGAGKSIRNFFQANRRWWKPHGLIILLFSMLFASHAEKPEHLLPVLPSLVLILADGISTRGWQAITLAFALNGLITLDVGEWRKNTGLTWNFQIRPGVVMNDLSDCRRQRESVLEMSRTLAQSGIVLRKHHEEYNLAWHQLYVSSVLKMIPEKLTPVVMLLPTDASASAPTIERWEKMDPPAAGWPMLIACQTNSALTLLEHPLTDDQIKKYLQLFCQNDPLANH